jgi:hypothetical protein
MRFKLFFATLISVLFTFAVAPFAAAASVSVLLYHRPQSTGSVLYDVKVLAGNSPNESITSPGGHAYNGFGAGINGLSEHDLFAEIVGQWTILAPQFPWNSSAPVDSYAFSISQFDVANLFTVYPTITNPVDGSVVPPHFALDFEWPQGVTLPSSRVVSSSFSNSISKIDVGVSVGPTSFPVNVTFKPGQTDGTLTMAVGTTQALNQYVSAVTPVTPNPPTTYTATLTFNNLSRSVSFAVSAPEPHTGMLLGFVAVPMLLARLRRRIGKL